MRYFNPFQPGLVLEATPDTAVESWDSLSRASLIEFPIPVASARGNLAKWSEGKMVCTRTLRHFAKNTLAKCEQIVGPRLKTI